MFNRIILVINIRHNGLILNALSFSLFFKKRFKLNCIINPNLLNIIITYELLSYIIKRSNNIISLFKEL
jgi:hypothetical protein